MNRIVRDTMFMLYNVLNVKKAGRHLKMKFDIYINKIFYVLKYGIPWRALNTGKLHYTTYHKFFQKLISLNIFELTFNSLSHYYYKRNVREFKNLFIDSTMIKNINGKDFIGKNHYDRNRNGNKITVLVNNKGIPVSIHLSTANVHDSKLTVDTISNACVKIVRSRVIADKGYINPLVKRRVRRTNNISLIYPYRSNQRAVNSTFEKNLLKKRHIVENFFSWLKKYRRIQQRYDSLSKTYLNFVYLGAIDILSKKN